MRIAIRGRRSLDDVRRCLIATLDKLADMGVTHTWGTNFYLNPCSEDGAEVVVLWRDGTEVELLELPAPRRREVPASSSTEPPKPSTNVVPFARR